jgi:hypothetical protein
LFDQIQAIAYNDARNKDSEQYSYLYLITWFCNKYNKPRKDPILLSYSIEELAYEFFIDSEIRKADKEKEELEHDKIEEAKQNEAESWADKMEREEREAEEAKKLAKENLPTPEEPIAEIPDDAWMELELNKLKQTHGEDFGEDLNLQF